MSVDSNINNEQHLFDLRHKVYEARVVWECVCNNSTSSQQLAEAGKLYSDALAEYENALIDKERINCQ